MRLLFFIFALIGCSSSWGADYSSKGTAQKIVCHDSSSKLVLEAVNTIYAIEGSYEYNQMENGEYGSIAMLGCDFKPGKGKWDSLDCMETTYAVYYSIYKIPKNVFSFDPLKRFSVVERRRYEDSGETSSTSIFTNCFLQ